MCEHNDFISIVTVRKRDGLYTRWECGDCGAAFGPGVPGIMSAPPGTNLTVLPDVDLKPLAAALAIKEGVETPSYPQLLSMVRALNARIAQQNGATKCEQTGPEHGLNVHEHPGAGYFLPNDAATQVALASQGPVLAPAGGDRAYVPLPPTSIIDDPSDAAGLDLSRVDWGEDETGGEG